MSVTTFLLLATFNGARFLAAQIDSLRSQTVADWTLLVRDDGSTDATMAQLEAAAAADRRIEIVRDRSGRLGPIGNFSRLCEMALARGAAAAFFVDQDDIWCPDKIERSLAALLAIEHRVGPEVPLLVHSDLEVIDAHGRPVHGSFMRLQHIHHERDAALTTLLNQNFVTGCASVINRPLLALGTPVPSGALMHDWWFALCAATTGEIAFLPEAMARYRRHDGNTVTVRGYWRTLNPAATNWWELWRTGVTRHREAVEQAEALLMRLHERSRPSSEPRGLVRAFIDLHRARTSPLGRVAKAARLGLKSQSLPRTVALYLRLLTWKG